MFSRDESLVFGMAQGCPTHGDETLCECNICGIEFCTACDQSFRLCPECAQQTETDDPLDKDLFEDLDHLDIPPEHKTPADDSCD